MIKTEILLEPFSPKADRLFHILIFFIALGSLLLFITQYHNVSSLASVDFDLSKTEIFTTAKLYAEKSGFQVSGYKSTITFETNHFTSIFFEKTLGTSRANELMHSQVPTRYWEVRWFKPLQEEEFSVSVTPGGHILGFNHTIPENAPGAELEQEEARRIAVEFLRIHDILLSDFEFWSSSSEKRDNRMDHVFTWRETGFDFGGSKKCMSVAVHGETIGQFDRVWIDIPENFSRQFAKDRSYARILTKISNSFFGLFYLCTFFSIMWFYKHRTLRIKLFAGIAAAMLALKCLSILNDMPLYLSDYSTNQSLFVYLFNRMFGRLQSSCAFVCVFAITAMSGEAIARELWKDQNKILNNGSDIWISLAKSTYRGVCLGLFGLGYIVVYQYIVQKFGAWYPLDEPYTNMLGTRIPLLDPLLTGVFPAFSEEALSRLFAISFLLLLFGRKWAALAIPAMVWAFAHSWYLTDPVYLRGVELTIKGLIYGFIFIKYDFITVVMGHLTYNAIVVGMPLFRSDDTYIFSCGVAIVVFLLAPLIPGCYRMMAKKGTSPADRE